MSRRRTWASSVVARVLAYTFDTEQGHHKHCSSNSQAYVEFQKQFGHEESSRLIINSDYEVSNPGTAWSFELR